MNEEQLEAQSDELEEIETDLLECIDAALGDLSEDKEFRLKDIQPPSSVIAEAAKAATAVFMAFERGYRM